MIDQLLSPEVQKYIKDHQNDDPFLLSLNAKKSSGFPLAAAIEQIQSRQKAKTKLPSWLKKETLIFPPPISIEQSSSEFTAHFKASLVHGNSMVDLTGGMGVDASFFADRFKEVNYVESNPHLCELARHNFEILDKDVKIYQSTAEKFLHDKKKHFDAIFIDPSRRNENQKVFKVEDCSPNLFDIVPKCKLISDQILIKLSPLVDLSLLIKEFDPADIWIVAARGEVKEVLCLLRREKKPVKIHAIDLLDHDNSVVFEFDWDEEHNSQNEYSIPLKYIYEPNAAILKAGAFKLVGERFKLRKLHQHTHLYTSEELVSDFPGKTLEITETLKQSKKEIQKAIPRRIINIITRNFPLSSVQLKKKFDLKDGGDQFLIGATLMDEKKVLLRCKRILTS